MSFVWHLVFWELWDHNWGSLFFADKTQLEFTTWRNDHDFAISCVAQSLFSTREQAHLCQANHTNFWVTWRPTLFFQCLINTPLWKRVYFLSGRNSYNRISKLRKTDFLWASFLNFDLWVAPFTTTVLAVKTCKGSWSLRRFWPVSTHNSTLHKPISTCERWQVI